MVQLALAGEFVPFAVNLAAAEAHENLRPFLPLAERLGRLFGSLVAELPSTVEIGVEGDIGGYDTRIVGLAVLKGLFGARQRRAGHVRQRAAAGARVTASTCARSARRTRPTTSTWSRSPAAGTR